MRLGPSFSSMPDLGQQARGPVSGDRDPYCIGVDAGGTFTDLVLAGPGGWHLYKVPSRADRPELPGIEALRQIDARGQAPVLHGSTVATNALLERKGARCALVLTAGFEDLLAIGRGQRDELYALEPSRRTSLIGADDGLCLGLDERLAADGTVLRSPSEAELQRLCRGVAALEVTSVAVCLLFSWLDDRHEQALARALRSAGLAQNLSLSSVVLPTAREVERASTTLANAYLMPLMRGFLQRLTRGLGARPLAVMGSHAGLLAPPAAGRLPVTTVLSGPAGGVLAAQAVARRHALGAFLSLDMGGTSTDVAFSAGDLVLEGSSCVGGVDIHRPALRIQTVGAGGGSLVEAAQDAALRLGPASAGAWPGPAAYGRGGVAPTLTDALVVLGRLPDGLTLADGTRLSLDRAAKALGPVASRLGLDLSSCALGAVALADARMERALRRVSVEAGIDPRVCGLVAFGGAAGMHACAVAEGLGIARVVVPAAAGVLSALGLAGAAPSASGRLSMPALGWPAGRRAWPRLVEAGFLRLRSQARRDLGRWVPDALLVEHRQVDLRYEGQSWDLTLPWEDDPRALRGRFEDLHEARYGFRLAGRPPRLVALRLTLAGPPLAPEGLSVREDPAARRQQPSTVNTCLPDGRRLPLPCRPASQLRPGEGLKGPAIVLQTHGTLFLAPGWTLDVLPGADLLLRPVAAGPTPTGDCSARAGGARATEILP